MKGAGTAVEVYGELSYRVLCICYCCADMLEIPNQNSRNYNPDERQDRHAKHNPVEHAYALEEFLHYVVTPSRIHS